MGSQADEATCTGSVPDAKHGHEHNDAAPYHRSSFAWLAPRYRERKRYQKLRAPPVICFTSAARQTENRESYHAAARRRQVLAAWSSVETPVLPLICDTRGLAA